MKAIERIRRLLRHCRGDGTATTISLGETALAVHISTELADDWVVERAAHLVESAPDVTVGVVRVRAER